MLSQHALIVTTEKVQLGGSTETHTGAPCAPHKDNGKWHRGHLGGPGAAPHRAFRTEGLVKAALGTVEQACCPVPP